MLIFLVEVVAIDYNKVYSLILSLKLHIIDHLHNKSKETAIFFFKQEFQLITCLLLIIALIRTIHPLIIVRGLQIFYSTFIERQ